MSPLPNLEALCALAYKGKKILITGTAGTVGSQLVKQLLKYDPAEIRLFDNNESGLFMQIQTYCNLSNVFPILGDIRDSGKLSSVIEGVNIVFHLAACKHVALCEYNPFDAVRTNVIGTQNVLKAALDAGVERVLYTSSDKAVNPTNVMGISKLLAERVVTAASLPLWNGHKRRAFSVTRFGNVLGSNGSVVPVFMRQIENGGPVTVTDTQMTRFVMTVEEAVRLVIKAAALAKGGEVLVTKMPVVRILDLAEEMIDLLAPIYGHRPEDIEIKIIGSKPGEKLYEELMTEEEIHRALELEDMFLVMPAMRESFDRFNYDYPNVISRKVDQPYISSLEEPMSKAQITNYLVKNHILRMDTREPYFVESRPKVMLSGGR